MSILEDGGRSLIQFSKLFEPILKLGPELERIGSIESHEQKLKGNIVNLNKEADKIKADNEKSKADFLEYTTNKERNLQQQQQAINNDRKSADEYLKNKKAEANDIIMNANAEGVKIITNAEKDAQNIINAANNEIETQNKIIEEKKAVVKSIDADIKSRNKALADINKTLEGIRV